MPCRLFHILIFLCTNNLISSLNLLKKEKWDSQATSFGSSKFCHFQDVIVDVGRIYFKPKPEFAHEAALDLFTCCMEPILQNTYPSESVCSGSVHYKLCSCFGYFMFWPAVATGVHNGSNKSMGHLSGNTWVMHHWAWDKHPDHFTMKLLELHALYANNRSLLTESDSYYNAVPQPLNQLLSMDYYVHNMTNYESFIMDLVYAGLGKVIPYYSLNANPATHWHTIFDKRLINQISTYCSISNSTLVHNKLIKSHCPVEFNVLAHYSVEHAWISSLYKNNIPVPFSVSKLSLDTSLSKVLRDRNVTVPIKSALVIAILQRNEGGGNRRFLNLDEVSRAVNKVFHMENVQIWYINSHTTAIDQVLYFKRFDVLITPHSSQLSNLIFARPGSHVIELQHEGFEITFHALGSKLGLHYQVLYNNKSLATTYGIDGKNNGFHYWDMTVHISMLENALQLCNIK